MKFYGDLAQQESGTIALSSAPEVIGYANTKPSKANEEVFSRAVTQ